MAEYFGIMLASLGQTLSWPGILIPIAGTLLAMMVSFVPGIGSASVMAILLVLTLEWPVQSVLLLFGALVGGATYMGSVTAILFNVPGSAPNAAALFDGYPLSRRGFSRTALACAATASAVGSIIGVLILLLILPFLPALLSRFGPLEQLLLGLWGLSAIVILPRVPKSRAMLMCMFGFLLAMVGTDAIEGTPRWNFGSIQLLSGLQTVPVLLGLFTIGEIISWKDQQLNSKGPVTAHPDDSIRAGVVAVFRHRWLTLRSSIIGTLVGIVPGVGGTVAGFVAYGAASREQPAQAADALDQVPFGEGNIRGLIAPEAAVDAKDGGSLLPAVSIGMPGSEAGVFLVTVLTLHGLVPGAPMLGPQLPLTFILIFALLFSNLLTSVLGLGMAPYLAKLGRLPLHLAVIPLLLLSLYLILRLNGQWSDVVTAVLFGLLGYFLKSSGWPRIPLVIAFVLGDFVERNLTLTVRLLELERITIVNRPVALVILALLIVSVLYMGRRDQAPQNLAIPTSRDRLICSAALLTSVILLAVAVADGYSGLSLLAAGVSFLLACFLTARNFLTSVQATR